MSEPIDYDVWMAMKTYGGSFVQHLGELFLFADSTNHAKLKAAFPDYWAKYRELAILKAARAGETVGAVDPGEDLGQKAATREKGI